MNNYLAELLDYEIEAHHLDFRELPGHQERLERICACHDRIQSELGLNFLDQLDELQGEETDLERLACFRHGFRLALRLVFDLPR
ncbi:MAG TPA: hypothetical protein H9941_03280 [Candidatus Flavonifractor avistercoris]|nr:hypothetical protein [Candidatus Flavonifractor avistercoris]